MSFEQAPPLGVPLRFFLTAPLFGCGAGLLIAILGDEVLASRWSGAALALTHLLTLGFMLQAMSGALLQVLPVAVGANVWQPRLVALLTHLGLVLGTLLLVAGFLLGGAAWFRWAVPVLAATLLCFVAVVGLALMRTGARSPTITLLRLAILSLAITMAFGVSLATTFGWSATLPAALLTDLHAGWGILGWGLLLVAAVAILVVPMFQLTPPYRKGSARAFPLILVATLALWSIATSAGAPLEAAGAAASVLLGLMVAGFAVETLRLQQRRRRRHGDAMFLFWRTGMLALLVAVVLGFALLAIDDPLLRGRLELAIGLAVLIGFFVSVINGMCYKIVPFLTWLHLQQRVVRPPNMNQVIGERAMLGQLRLHWAALAMLALGLLYAPLLVPGGLLFAASCAWLEVNLARAARLYLRLGQDAAPA